MTITFAEYTAGLTLDPAGARALVEVIVIAVLVVVLLQREMLRNRPHIWARAGGAALTAVAIPLAVAWVAIIVQRFIDLLN